MIRNLRILFFDSSPDYRGVNCLLGFGDVPYNGTKCNKGPLSRFSHFKLLLNNEH